MKVRIPNQGGGSQKQMLQQFQQLQENMQKKQEELESREYEVTSGGGMVKVVIGGTKQIKTIHIAPEAVDPEDIEMLEDLLTAAVNEAIAKVEQTAEEEMGSLTAGMNLPNIPGLGL